MLNPSLVIGRLSSPEHLRQVGLGHLAPDLDKVIKEHASDDGRALLLSLEKMTTAEAVIKMAHKDMGDFLDEPLEKILSTPAVSHVFDSSSTKDVSAA